MFVLTGVCVCVFCLCRHLLGGEPLPQARAVLLHACEVRPRVVCRPVAHVCMCARVGGCSHSFIHPHTHTTHTLTRVHTPDNACMHAPPVLTTTPPSLSAGGSQPLSCNGTHTHTHTHAFKFIHSFISFTRARMFHRFRAHQSALSTLGVPCASHFRSPERLGGEERTKTTLATNYEQPLRGSGELRDVDAGAGLREL